MSVTISGGQKAARFLREIVDRMGTSPTLSVGFLEDSKYPNGVSVPMVAMIQEYGATINHEASTVTVYRKIDTHGDFLRNGRFVKRKDSNFATTHERRAFTTTIPPRPFFRTAVAEHSAEWPRDAVELIRTHNYDMPQVAMLMGQKIKEQIQQSIIDWKEPPNAPSTIRKKGFNKPLIDTGQMMRSVDYNVS